MADVAEDVPAPAPVAATESEARNEEAAPVEGSDVQHEASSEAELSAKTAAQLDEVDTELEAMKRRLQQMEAESLALKPNEVTTGEPSAGADADGEADPNVVAVAQAAARAVVQEVNAGQDMSGTGADEAVADADSRSIYVGNVDYAATVDELSAYFSECGTINRVTILTHKPTGQPKGFAYIEFKDQHAVQNAMILNESMFKGRQLKITPKRTNVPGVSRGGYRGRGRGFSRGGRGYYYGRRPRPRGRGRWVPY